MNAVERVDGLEEGTLKFRMRTRLSVALLKIDEENEPAVRRQGLTIIREVHATISREE